jgi:hypothetical protein
MNIFIQWSGAEMYSYFLNVTVYVFLQIFYDLVRQINKKSPEKKPKQKKKSLCVLL